MSYICQKDTWSINELISHCMQVEERIKQDKAESAHSTTTSKEKRRTIKKDKDATDTTPQKKQKEQFDDKCFFSCAARHKKK